MFIIYIRQFFFPFNIIIKTRLNGSLPSYAFQIIREIYSVKTKFYECSSEFFNLKLLKPLLTIIIQT